MKILKATDPNFFRRNLYAICLPLCIVLGVLIFLNFQLVQEQVGAVEQDTQTLRLIENHRVFIQRISLLSESILFSADDAQRKVFRRRLHLVIDEMKKNSEDLFTRLREGLLPAHIWEAQKSARIMSDTKHFTSEAASFLAVPDAELAADQASYQFISRQVTSGELFQLYDVLMNSFREHVQRRADQSVLQGMIFAFSSFLILVVIVFLLMIPMLKRIQHQMEDRDISNRKLFRQTRELIDSRRAVLSMMEDANIARLKSEKSMEAVYRLAAIVESSSDAIIGKKLDGTITSWNKGAEDLYGYTASEAVGKRIDFIMPEDLVPQEFPRIMKAVMERNKIERYETKRKCKDGTLVDISLSVSPVLDEHGHLIGASSIARNITEKKANERRLRQVMKDLTISNRDLETLSETLRAANDKLRELDTLKSEFIMMASHELRTPLTTIKGYIALLADGKAGKISAKQKQFLDYVHASADRLHRMLSDMLSISRIESGQMHFEFKETDMDRIVDEEVDAFRLQARDKDITVDARIEGKLGKIVCDPDRIEEVIENLLSNALKYTPRGGKVEVTGRQHGNYVELRIADSGIGIPANKMKSIFDPFPRITRRGPEGDESIGLGLALVKRIVDMHSGEVRAQSEEGKGSVFAVFLPQKPELPPRTP